MHRDITSISTGEHYSGLYACGPAALDENRLFNASSGLTLTAMIVGGGVRRAFNSCRALPRTITTCGNYTQDTLPL
jgi:hypothetical protein